MRCLGLTADVCSIFEQHIAVHPPVCPPSVADSPVWHLTWGGGMSCKGPHTAWAAEGLTCAVVSNDDHCMVQPGRGAMVLDDSSCNSQCTRYSMPHPPPAPPTQCPYQCSPAMTQH